MNQTYNFQKLLITEPYKLEFREILLNTYFANFDPAYLASEPGERDIEDHVFRRMMEVENIVLPWVREVYDITDKSVLEIGCGTGSATIPFARKVSSIHSYDISQKSLDAAEHRAILLGANNINFQLLEPHWAQSEDALSLFSKEASEVDIVLMIALLEHLTIEERINVLRVGWERLKPGGIMIIYETPNRIGYFDWHSFWLPFFHYLPDQLALLYSVKTQRGDSIKVPSQGNLSENLYRIGRGVSYHEFELALNFEELTVINDGYYQGLQEHRKNLSNENFDEALLEIFQEHLPHIPRGFAKPSLDLIIAKSPPSPERIVMTDSPAQIVQALCNRDSEFAGTYQAYRSQLQNWTANSVLPTSHITGKRILDWECGRGVFTALLLEQGAAAVTAIDSWLVDSAYIQKNLSGLPGASFERISLEQFAVDEQHHGAYDLIFANTVTEHMLNLPPLLTICYQLLAVDGELVINHGNYYEPVGSHDHGFLFYGENNEIVFQGPRCWESTTKCEASADFRRSLRERFSWTWGDWNESQLTPDNCIYCPYYRRAQPWSHLLYQQEFRQIFPQQGFTTGYPGSGLNKITPFQLRQFLIEAGFNIERWVPSYINNQPPEELLRPPFNFSIEDLCTAVIAVRCSKAALPEPLHWTYTKAASSSLVASSSQATSSPLLMTTQMTQRLLKFIPEKFLQVPNELSVVQAAPTVEEIEQAKSIRQKFLLKGASFPYMMDVIRAFRLITGCTSYLEIGTEDKGNLAYVSQLLDEKALIIDIDVVERKNQLEKLNNSIKPDQQLVSIVGSSTDEKVINQVREVLAGNKLDAVFIDGNHTSAYVMSDFANYYEFIKDDGYILFHDIYWQGDAQYQGTLQALIAIDKLYPVFAVVLDSLPVHRLLPYQWDSGEVWGCVGIVRKCW